MRSDMYDCLLFQFLRWAVNANDDRVYYGQSKSNEAFRGYTGRRGGEGKSVSVSVSKQPYQNQSESESEAEAGAEAKRGQKNIAEAKAEAKRGQKNIADAKGADSKEDNLGHKDTDKEEEIVGSLGKLNHSTFTDTSHVYPFADADGRVLCERYVQRICQSRFCPLEHGRLQNIGFVKQYPSVSVRSFSLSLSLSLARERERERSTN